MDPFRGQGGIQMLLTAEQDAQQVVSTARNSIYYSVSSNHFQNSFQFNVFFS